MPHLLPTHITRCAKVQVHPPICPPIHPPTRPPQVLLGLVLLPPVVAGVTAILMHTGQYVGLLLWAFLLAISLVMMTIYPTLIAPLFNSYVPLPEGTLR